MRMTLWILAVSALALGFSSSVAAQPPCQPMCEELLSEHAPDALGGDDIPALGVIAELLPFALVGLALGQRLRH